MNFKKDADHVIERDRFWQSFKVAHGSGEKKRENFFGLLGKAFLSVGYKGMVTSVKRKRKAHGYRGLAFFTQSPSATSSQSFKADDVEKWMLMRYSEGGEGDFVRKAEIWDHFKQENGIPDESQSDFFSH